MEPVAQRRARPAKVRTLSVLRKMPFKVQDEDDTGTVVVAQGEAEVGDKAVMRGVAREPGELPAKFPLPRRQRPLKKRAANSNGSCRRRMVSRNT